MTRTVSPDLAARLGTLVIRWSVVEHWISELFSFLTKGDPGLMLIVTVNISQSTLTTWIRTLNDIYKSPGDLQQRIRDILAEVDELRGERNTLVHGIWHTGTEPNSVIVQTVKLERAEIVRDLVVTAADLNDLIERVIEVNSRLADILREIGARK